MVETQDVHSPEYSNGRFELELLVKSDWGEIARVNETMFTFLNSRGLSPDLINKYTMIVSELVENSLKYGFFKKPDDVVVVAVRIVDDTFSVLVKNPIGDQTRIYLDELDRTIQWVRGFHDPFEAYIERMRAISREPIDVDKSGLGIARITYEGRAALDFFVDEDNTLSLSAVSKHRWVALEAYGGIQ